MNCEWENLWLFTGKQMENLSVGKSNFQEKPGRCYNSKTYLPWLRVRVEVWEEMTVDSSLLSSFKDITKGCRMWLQVTQIFSYTTTCISNNTQWVLTRKGQITARLKNWLIYMFIKFISTRKAPTHTHDLLLQIINRMKTDFGSVYSHWFNWMLLSLFSFLWQNINIDSSITGSLWRRGCGILTARRQHML